MLSYRTEFSWYVYEASCSQLSSLESLGVLNQDSILSRGPLERAGAPDQEPMGLFGDHGATYDGVP